MDSPPVIAHSTAQSLIDNSWAKVEKAQRHSAIKDFCIASDCVEFMSNPQRGEWTLLVAELPERPAQRIGVLFADIDANRLYVRVKQDWWADFSNQDDAEVWRELMADIEHKAKEMGAADFLGWLEDTASHALRITARQPISFRDPENTLDILYQQHIAAPE